LWNMIDWGKWWFYEDEQIEFGGLAEWVCLGAKHAWGNGEHDPGHPSPTSHREFCEKIITELLDEIGV